MPTRRTPLGRKRRELDDFCLAELMTLQPGLIHGGFYDASAEGIRCVDKRDTIAIEETWRERELELLRLWIGGWIPANKWVGAYTPGKPGTRPPGWWKYRAPEPRPRREP